MSAVEKRLITSQADRYQESTVLSPDRPLAALATALFYSPVLTKNTIDHREKGKYEFYNFLQRHKLDDSRHFALPIGSQNWIVKNDGTSDNDILVICDDQHAKKRLSEEWTREIEIDRRREFPSPLRIHAITEYELLGIAGGHHVGGHDFLAHLFLTPDTFIMGNVNNARLLRLRLIDEIKNQKRMQQVWNNENSIVRSTFLHHIVGWPINGEPKQLEREARLFAVLQARGRRLLGSLHPTKRNPSYVNDYRSWYFGTLARLHRALPSFNVVARELKASGGRIDVLPEFVAYNDFNPNSDVRSAHWGNTDITIAA